MKPLARAIAALLLAGAAAVAIASSAAPTADHGSATRADSIWSVTIDEPGTDAQAAPGEVTTLGDSMWG